MRLRKECHILTIHMHENSSFDTNWCFSKFISTFLNILIATFGNQQYMLVVSIDFRHMSLLKFMNVSAEYYCGHYVLPILHDCSPPPPKKKKKKKKKWSHVRSRSWLVIPFIYFNTGNDVQIYNSAIRIMIWLWLLWFSFNPQMDKWLHPM